MAIAAPSASPRLDRPHDPACARRGCGGSGRGPRWRAGGCRGPCCRGRRRGARGRRCPRSRTGARESGCRGCGSRRGRPAACSCATSIAASSSTSSAVARRAARRTISISTTRRALEGVGQVGLRERQEEVERRKQGARLEVGHVGAAAVTAVDDPEDRERAQRLAQARPADAEDLDQLALGRQPVAGAQHAGPDEIEDAVDHRLRHAGVGRPIAPRRSPAPRPWLAAVRHRAQSSQASAGMNSPQLGIGACSPSLIQRKRPLIAAARSLDQRLDEVARLLRVVAAGALHPVRPVAVARGLGAESFGLAADVGPHLGLHVARDGSRWR